MCHFASVTSSLSSICLEVGSFVSPLIVPTVLMKVVTLLMVIRRLVACRSSVSSSRGLVAREEFCSVIVSSGGCGSKSIGSC